jgi:hypothetical protein
MARTKVTARKGVLTEESRASMRVAGLGHLVDAYSAADAAVAATDPLAPERQAVVTARTAACRAANLAMATVRKGPPLTAPDRAFLIEEGFQSLVDARDDPSPRSISTREVECRASRQLIHRDGELSERCRAFLCEKGYRDEVDLMDRVDRHDAGRQALMRVRCAHATSAR